MKKELELRLGGENKQTKPGSKFKLNDIKYKIFDVKQPNLLFFPKRR